MSTVLSVESLGVAYGDVPAVSGVTFELGEGECLAVLGTNGAGKSSLAKALANLVSLASGTITYIGSVTAASDGKVTPPYRLARDGVAYVPEGRGIFPGLTVAENIALGARVLPRAQRGAAEAEAYELFPVLQSRRDQIAGTMSGGEQQILALSRALVTKPKLLIADELSMGLAPIVIDSIYAALAKGREMGVTMVIVEQYIDRVLALADRALVLKRGSMAWSGDVRGSTGAIVREYIGSEGEE